MKKIVLIGALLLGTVGNGYGSSAEEPPKITPMASAGASITEAYSKYHKGVDLTFDAPANITSPFTGHVESMENYDDMCFVILTNDKDGSSVVFVNLYDSPLHEGDNVKAGEIIGDTGQEALHISYYPKGVKEDAVDPEDFLHSHGLTIKKQNS